MAARDQQNAIRPVQADSHPTPVSGYFALLIMAAIAAGMLALQLAG